MLLTLTAGVVGEKAHFVSRGLDLFLYQNVCDFQNPAVLPHLEVLRDWEWDLSVCLLFLQCCSEPSILLWKYLFVWLGQKVNRIKSNYNNIGGWELRMEGLFPRFMTRHFTKCMHPVIKTPPCLQEACKLANTPHCPSTSSLFCPTVPTPRFLSNH